MADQNPVHWTQKIGQNLIKNFELRVEGRFIEAYFFCSECDIMNHTRVEGDWTCCICGRNTKLEENNLTVVPFVANH